MRKYLIRFAVFTLTGLIGAVGAIWHRANTSSLRAGPEKQIQEGKLPRLAFTHSELDEDLPKSLSPHDIALFADGHPDVNLTKLWQALGIDARDFDAQKITGRLFPMTCQNCRAEIFEYDLDGIPGTEVLLQMETPTYEASRYLVFKYVSSDWKLLGHIDAWSKYRRPQHKVIISHGLAWLAIENQGASGIGVATYFDRVYLVTPRRVIEALSYVTRGNQYGGPDSTSREFDGRVLDCSIANNIVTAEIEYSVTYGGNGISLFTKKQKAVVSKGIGSQSQSLDPNRSDLGNDELDAVYNIDTLSNEDFLKYNYGELSQIAKDGDVEKREWLRQFLSICENTVENRRLKRLLTR